MLFARALTWWASSACLFMLLVAEWTALDWMAAGAAGLAAAGLAAIMWRAGLLHHGFRLRWLSAVPKLALQTGIDFGIITVALVRQLVRRRREPGAFVARDDFPAGGDGPRDIGWRAWVAIAATWSPNSYVIDIDREAGTRLSHDLVPHRPSETPA